MPFRPQHSLLRIEVPALHTIDTSSVENLMGIWSLFRSASNAMEDGRRLENLSWRLWNRETFCCSPESNPKSHASSTHSTSFSRRKASTSRPTTARSDTGSSQNNLPELSSSLDSASDLSEAEDLPEATPELRRRHSRGHEKHITPESLQKIVTSITQTPDVAPIDLPMYDMPTLHHVVSPPTPTNNRTSAPDETFQQAESIESTETATPPAEPVSKQTTLDSSSSTINTQGSHNSAVNHNADDSSSTEMSTHSIVRGFIAGGAPSSYRSQTNLPAAAVPTPILKSSPKYHQSENAPKKKGAMFTIGTSSGEEESSLDSHMYKSSMSDNLKRSISNRKITTFQEEMAMSRAANSAVFESDDEDEEVSESAIDDDDDDSSDWEDSDEGSGPSSVNEREMFQRVDSRPNLTSRRSMLTTLIHEPDRAAAMANAASRSSPAIRRSRQGTPNGPSVAGSPAPSALSLMPSSTDQSPRPPASGAQPITVHHNSIAIPQSSSNHQLALSPRTTRRNMLSTELTESLRKNLLWERQHKSTGNLSTLRKRANTHQQPETKPLRQQPEPGPVMSSLREGSDKKVFSNEYFHHGLGEYHSKGW